MLGRIGNMFSAPAELASKDGVLRTRVGFAGGSAPNANYRAIGDHTEVVQILYDPSRLSYSDLLRAFFALHDPTTRSTRQYMSLVLYESEEEKTVAEELVKELQGKQRRPITTEIAPLKDFYQAEDYHQKYLLRQTPKLFYNLGLEGDALVADPVAAKLNAICGGYVPRGAVVTAVKNADTGINDGILNIAEEIAAKGPPMAACGL